MVEGKWVSSATERIRCPLRSKHKNFLEMQLTDYSGLLQDEALNYIYLSSSYCFKILSHSMTSSIIVSNLSISKRFLLKKDTNGGFSPKKLVKVLINVRAEIIWILLRIWFTMAVVSPFRQVQLLKQGSEINWKSGSKFFVVHTSITINLCFGGLLKQVKYVDIKDFFHTSGLSLIFIFDNVRILLLELWTWNRLFYVIWLTTDDIWVLLTAPGCWYTVGFVMRYILQF